MWLKSKGKVVVDQRLGRVVVELSYDFANYYNWFVTREFKIIPFVGRFKPHISLILPKFHKDVDWKRALKYHGRSVNFSYCIDVQEGGKKSEGRFVSFWLRTNSPELDQLRIDLGMKPSDHLHVTLGNTKAATIPWNGPSVSIT